MFKIILAVLATVVIIPFALAQDPIYVPFEWDKIPLTATNLGSSGGQTTFGLLEGPSRARATVGPAVLVQGASGASMLYSAPTATLSGVCNLVSPVAVCTLNVYETGAPLPPAGNGGGGSITTTSKKGSSTGNGNGNGNTGGTGGSGVPGSSAGTILAMTTVALGFCISLVFVR